MADPKIPPYKPEPKTWKPVDERIRGEVDKQKPPATQAPAPKKVPGGDVKPSSQPIGSDYKEKPRPPTLGDQLKETKPPPGRGSTIFRERPVVSPLKAPSAQKGQPKGHVKDKGRPVVQKDVAQHRSGKEPLRAESSATRTPLPRVATGEGTTPIPQPAMDAGTPKPVMRTLEDVRKSGKPGYVDTMDVGGRKALQVSNFEGSDDVKADLRSKGYVEIVINHGGKRTQFFVTPGDLSAIKLIYPEPGVVREVK